MKAKNPSGGSCGLMVPKVMVESRKTSRPGNERKIRMEDTTIFPPLRVDQRMDPKLPSSHSIQEDCIGKEGQVTGLRSVGSMGDQMKADEQRTNGKLPSSDLSWMIGNEDVRVEASKSPMKERSSSSADLHAFVIPDLAHLVLREWIQPVYWMGEPTEKMVVGDWVPSFQDLVHPVSREWIQPVCWMGEPTETMVVGDWVPLWIQSPSLHLKILECSRADR